MDTEFLGDGILDEEQSLRPGAGGVDPAAFNLADAVILGNIDDESQSFETSDSGFHLSANLHARLYVSGRSQALMSPDAVPAMLQAADGLRLTPFEKHVLEFIDGRRPVEQIRKAAGLDEAEVKTALATLADKGIVKVVGRALSDVDFDAETVPKSPFRRARVRGSMVGAVALVGDDADKAIDEAFRTQVSLSPLKQALPADAGANTGFNTRARGGASLPSDADSFVDIKGTDEVDKRLEARPPARANAPLGYKGAINQTTRAGAKDASVKNPPIGASSQPSSGSLESADASLLDDSDGFDDFSAPSSIATAVKAGQPSDSSVPSSQASAQAPEGKPGVFADLNSDVDNSALRAIGELADSRFLAPRPDLASLRLEKDRPEKKGARPQKTNAFAETPSLEAERKAASGEVWDESPKRASDDPLTNAKPQKTNATPLSDLLSDPAAGDVDATQNVPADQAAKMLARRRAEPSESYEEPTAAGQPPPPMALPKVGPRGAAIERVDRAAIAAALDAPENTGRQVRPAKKIPSAMVSMPDEEHLGARARRRPDVDEHSGLHGARPGRGAADDIFEDGEGDEVLDEASKLVERPPPLPKEDLERDDDDDLAASTLALAGMAANSSSSSSFAEDDGIDASEESDPDPVPARPPRPPQPSRMVERAAREISEDQGDDEAAAFASQSPATKPSDPDSIDSTGDPPAPKLPHKPVVPRGGPAPLMSTHASSLPSEDATMPPSVLSKAKDDDESSAGPTDVRAEHRAGGPPRRSSSSELLDSALLIRPAAKAAPLSAALAAAKSSGSRPQPRRMPPASPVSAESNSMPSEDRRPASAESAAPSDEGDAPASDEQAEHSTEATVNVDAHRRPDANRDVRDAKKGNVGIGKDAPRGAAAIPSGFSEIAGRAEKPQAARGKPTLEMVRNGRRLFEEAEKERAAGRMGAARMNAKLASIYDPDNETYKRALEEWDEDGPKNGGNGRVGQTGRNVDVSSGPSHSDESQQELRQLYDEAQAFEESGDFDDALEALERGVERYPNAAAFHNRIGVLLAMKKRDFDGAIAAIQRAIDIDPDNLHYRNNLGKVMQRVRGK